MIKEYNSDIDEQKLAVKAILDSLTTLKRMRKELNIQKRQNLVRVRRKYMRQIDQIDRDMKRALVALKAFLPPKRVDELRAQYYKRVKEDKKRDIQQAPAQGKVNVERAQEPNI